MSRRVLLPALALMGTLLGCNKSSSERNGNVPRIKGQPATTAVAEAATPQTSAPAALLIRVLQEDSDAGVAAVVSRLDDTGGAHFVADVDDTGIARLTQPCAAGDRFEANPKVEAFLRVAPQPCAQTVTFRLYSARATYELIRVAENDEKTGDFAAAQARYGLAAERLQFSKPLEADRVKTLASKNVGKLLGVDQPTTVVDGKHRISPMMVDQLRLYQQKANIPVTGVIDQRTRDALSREKATKIAH
jgi:putative peptidoglycan binding protein